MIYSELATENWPAAELFEAAESCFLTQGYSRSDFAPDAADLNLAELRHFEFRGELFDFDFGPLGSYGFSLVTLTTKLQLAETLALIDLLTGSLRSRQTFVHDADYHRWQNAQDPLEFKAAGRPFEHLPLIDNGLPPPLNQKVVDTSRNPGRRCLREGLIEAVSSPMWLRSDLFGSAAALAGDTGAEVVPTETHLRISGQEQPCSQQSAHYQEALRFALYQPDS